jgi:hypothetical protein
MTKRLPRLRNTLPGSTTSSPSAASAKASGATWKGCSYPRSAIGPRPRSPMRSRRSARNTRAQTLQWFLSESTWDADAVNARRLALLRADPATAPDGRGVLVIDEHGDRKWGRKTAHVGRQYLANRGKTASGVVSVTSLWADEAVYWPVHYEPYTPSTISPRARPTRPSAPNSPLPGSW